MNTNVMDTNVTSKCVRFSNMLQPQREGVKKDETIESVIFTRYLYVKEEVEAALLISIFEKHLDSALFWAYELYESGFKEDLLHYIWTIYYNFFAANNPIYEITMLKLQKRWYIDAKIVYIYIKNLLTRDYNADMFEMIRDNITSKDNDDNISLPLFTKAAPMAMELIAAPMVLTATNNEPLLYNLDYAQLHSYLDVFLKNIELSVSFPTLVKTLATI